MRKATTIWPGALAVLACAASASAHHSGSMYVATATWIKGTVVRFEHMSPHSITTIEGRAADGRVRRWAVEGPPGLALDRLVSDADMPKVGDVVELCAFGYKSAEELARMFPGADFAARRGPVGTEASFAGHVMILPSGEMRLWEPHGILSECVRSSDGPRQSWLDFLRSSARARQAWCEQSRYAVVQSNVALQTLLEEVRSSIPDLCG